MGYKKVPFLVKLSKLVIIFEIMFNKHVFTRNSILKNETGYFQLGMEQSYHSVSNPNAAKRNCYRL